WRLALLLGAIVSSTDAAATFAVLRALPLPARLRGLLEAESGLNDAPTIILVLLFSGTGAFPGPGRVAGSLFFQLGAGAALGLATGFLAVLALRRIALPATGLYPLATVGFGVVAFAAAGLAGASGIISAYVCGVVLGNARLPHRAASRSFAEGSGWLGQIGLFVMLGLLVDPGQLPEAVVAGVVAGLVLLLVARPVSVLACLPWFRVPLREQLFLSWAGLRGAVPIVLATFPIVSGGEGALGLLHVVFVLVVVFTRVQAPRLAGGTALAGLGGSARLRGARAGHLPRRLGCGGGAGRAALGVRASRGVHARPGAEPPRGGPAARGDAAGPGPRGPGRGRAAGEARRRAAHADRPARLPPARRRDLRAAAARPVRRQPDRPRRGVARPDPHDHLGRGGRGAHRHHRGRPRGHRTPPPRGGPPRTPRPLARRARRPRPGRALKPVPPTGGRPGLPAAAPGRRNA